jgi:hypothetical protein
MGGGGGNAMQEPTPIKDEISQAAVLRLIFGLRQTEAQMLARLLVRDYVTKEELAAAASREDQTIGLRSTDTILYTLRKKLAPHDVRIATLFGTGTYGLDTKARNIIRKRLTRHNAVSSRLRAKSEVAEHSLELDAL